MVSKKVVAPDPRDYGVTFHAEWRDRVYLVGNERGPDDMQYDYAVFYPGEDILTGHRILLKGHSWRPLSEMEVLAYMVDNE